MQQRRLKVIWAGLTLCGIVGCVITAQCRENSAELAVRFAGFTSTDRTGRRALFLLSNGGSNPMQRNEFCTIDWSNYSGFSTSTVFALLPASKRLRSKEVETVSLVPPQGEGTWDASFSFSPVIHSPGGFLRSFPWLDWFSGSSRFEPLFVVLSPRITNNSSGFNVTSTTE